MDVLMGSGVSYGLVLSLGLGPAFDHRLQLKERGCRILKSPLPPMFGCNSLPQSWYLRTANCSAVGRSRDARCRSRCAFCSGTLVSRRSVHEQYCSGLLTRV